MEVLVMKVKVKKTINKAAVLNGIPG